MESISHASTDRPFSGPPLDPSASTSVTAPSGDQLRAILKYVENAMGTGVKKTTGLFTVEGHSAIEDSTAMVAANQKAEKVAAHLKADEVKVAAYHKAEMVAADQKAEAMEINDIEQVESDAESDDDGFIQVRKKYKRKRVDSHETSRGEQASRALRQPRDHTLRTVYITGQQVITLQSPWN